MIDMWGRDADDFKEFDNKTEIVFDKTEGQSWRCLDLDWVSF